MRIKHTTKESTWARFTRAVTSTFTSLTRKKITIIGLSSVVALPLSAVLIGGLLLHASQALLMTVALPMIPLGLTLTAAALCLHNKDKMSARAFIGASLGIIAGIVISAFTPASLFMVPILVAGAIALAGVGISYAIHKRAQTTALSSQSEAGTSNSVKYSPSLISGNNPSYGAIENATRTFPLSHQGSINRTSTTSLVGAEKASSVETTPVPVNSM